MKFAELPTTNIRILVTLGMFIATGAKYLITSNWEPSNEWLIFLCVMAGVDAVQHIGKRLSFKTENKQEDKKTVLKFVIRPYNRASYVSPQPLVDVSVALTTCQPLAPRVSSSSQESPRISGLFTPSDGSGNACQSLSTEIVAELPITIAVLVLISIVPLGKHFDKSTLHVSAADGVSI